MSCHYEIVPKGKKNYLYRIEADGTPVKLAHADDKKSMFGLIRMKNLFEDSNIPLKELHEAEALGAGSIKSNKPNWASVSLVGGRMEVWEISEAQTRALKRVREEEKDGLHRSVLDHRTADVLIRHGLVKQKRSCIAYLTLAEEGKKLLKRIER